MASLLSKLPRRRCYFSHQAHMGETCDESICIRHHIRISLRLLILLARSGRFGKIWRTLKWKI
jgi:hypothetical protein